jgi:peptidoglycan/xylan/chitin deacetylase (PgdA/CDA1 family)
MRLASPILKRFIYPALAKTGQLRLRSGAGPAIVTYHGVLPRGYVVRDRNADWSMVRPESLRQQLGLLKKHYRIITPGQFLAWCEGETDLPPNSVLITCDDGMQTAVTEMMPLLADMNLSGLFFVTEQALLNQASMLWHEELHLMLLTAPERISLHLPSLGIDEYASGRMEKRDLWWKLIHELSKFESVQRSRLMDIVSWQIHVKPNWKDAYAEDPVLQSRFFTLNLRETRALVEAGMSIGAHSLSHPILSQAPSDLAWREIAESKHRIEQALQSRVWAMAYPFGDIGSVGLREVGMVERAGYSCAFVNFGGGFGAPQNIFAMQRVHVTGDMSLSEFEAHVSGLHRSLRQRFFQKLPTLAAAA